MEKRTILAIVLAIVFIIAWQKFVVEKFVPKKPVNQKTEQTQIAKNEKETQNLNKEENKSQEVENEEAAAVSAVEKEETLTAVALPVIEEKEYVLENDYLKIVFTNKGGVAKSIVLKKYREKNGDLYDLVNKSIKKDYPFTFYGGKFDLSSITGEGLLEGNTLTFTFTLPDGTVVKKVFTLESDYRVKFSLKGFDGYFSLGAGINSSEKSTSRYSTEDEIAYYYDGKVRRLAKKKLADAEIPSEAKWVAIENKYFAKILTPEKKFEKLVPELLTYTENGKKYTLCSLKVKATDSFNGTFYLGPKEYERLGALGKTYKELVNFGWFGAFGKWLFIFLKWINKFVGNWGWSIVIFTILVRIVLFPLNSAGLKSAQKMKELQPKVKAIQEKYKKYGNDMTMKAKMNQELQELYKKEGVNPLGGCLPMLVQIPIFFAIYSLLLNIIDLRMAPWILWIKDLSAHDPYFVLPIAMGVTQLIVQLLTPAAGDKNQQRMMLIMPVVITFILIYAPAGLLLYWTTNNIFQIFQQLILNKQMKQMKTVS